MKKHFPSIIKFLSCNFNYYDKGISQLSEKNKRTLFEALFNGYTSSNDTLLKYII